MAATQPRVSIVVPTHNRSASLLRMLRALESQTFPLARLEVIVIADGCQDDTVEVVRGARTAFVLELVEQPGRGPAAARNAGAERACGSVLLFLDDDMEPTPGAVEAHVRVREAEQAQVVVGPSLPTFGAKPDFYSVMLRAWWHQQLGRMRRPGHRYTYHDVLSGNLSVDAEIFHRVGRFDEVFRCRDDYELGLRLLAAGAVVAYAPAALALHHETVDVERSFARARAEGQADVWIGQRHAQLRPTLSLARPRGSRPSLSELPRRAAFRHGRLGDRLARGLRSGLPALERLRLRRAWYNLYVALHDYWYWRGCAAELTSEQALARFLAASDERPQRDGLLHADLGQGLPAVEDLLDRERPAGLRLTLGSIPVGCVPARPDAERLRGAHLRGLLVEEMEQELTEALALHAAATSSR